ncbi:MAG TPA: family 1 glycosylhydrolase [Ktedonobacterales bacterium]|nr:family 1 glycosylhydrolase [Ktedonobacterales bacterium]
MAESTPEDGLSSPASMLSFPEGFRWGVATASHQYEGDNTNNNWYAWERAGRIVSGDSCGLAADWWAHAERDFDFAAQLDLNALRLSLEWSRIEPRPGEWDAQALARYRTMLQGLRERGIEPLVTLHHFTNPLWFEERGAFLASSCVELFARYVAHVVEALGDLCDFWCTINEPNIYAFTGYQLGVWPPGRKGATLDAIRVQGNMARAHAAAYATIHSRQPAARVGWAQNYNVFDAANPRSGRDRLLAGIMDAAFNDIFPRAVLTGKAVFPFSLAAGNLSAVRGTCDFVGINIYYRDLVTFDPRRPLEMFSRRSSAPGTPHGDTGAELVTGEVYPQGIARIARRVSAFGKPIYVTENGVADAHDRLRPWLLATATHAMHEAIADGIDLRGYYHWSLVDNFEWAEGWTLRFGLAALDIETQERTPRPSAALYGAIARANGLSAETLRDYIPEAPV